MGLLQSKQLKKRKRLRKHEKNTDREFYLLRKVEPEPPVILLLRLDLLFFMSSMCLLFSLGISSGIGSLFDSILDVTFSLQFCVVFSIKTWLLFPIYCQN